jgi:plastocyanin
MSARCPRPRCTLPETRGQSRARRVALALLVAATIVLGGCEHPPATPRPAHTPTPLDATTTGTISGHVRFAGPAPPPRRVEIASDPTCVAAHPEGLALDDVRGDAGMLADAFVYVARGLEDRVFAVPQTPVVVDQRGCLYVPRVVGAQVGQRIEFVNSDDTLHNVHGAPTFSPAWNFGLAFVGARRAIVLERAEVPVVVQCDVHPWMHAALGVVDHPYFAVTGRDGGFALAQVPAGHYVVAAWHPRLGGREQAVDVTPGATSTIELELALTP